MSILENDSAPQTDEIDPTKQYFSELVGETQKYKTQEDLARATLHKEAHIQRLEREMANLRDTLKTANTTKRMEDILDQLTMISQRPVSPSIEVTTPQEPDSESKKGLTLDDVQEALRKHEESNRLKSNSQAVKERLRQTLGTNYVTKVREKAESLGVGPEFLDSIAQTNPLAFYTLMGIEAPQRQNTGVEDISFAPPRGVTLGFKPSGNEKNMAYYDHMRKTDPVRYHSIKIQNEEHEEAQKAAREGRDFYG